MRLKLDLDDLGTCESPSSKYDIGYLRHYLIIEEENKEAFLDEITKNYRELINDLLEEYLEEEE